MASSNVLIEVCVDSVASAVAATDAGAGRLELCAGLAEGGLTPSAGLVAACRDQVAIPLYPIIRPRGGDFVYSDAELDVMERDIATMKQLGADGVVLGLLEPDGSVDLVRTRAMVAAARPLDVTFHRAFDQTRDPEAALEAVIAAGADRILTSGHAASASDGIPLLAKLVQRAAGRLAVLAGGGITEENVGRIVAASGVREVHVRGASVIAGAARYRNPAITFLKPALADESVRTVADRDRIRLIVSRARDSRPNQP